MISARGSPPSLCRSQAASAIARTWSAKSPGSPRRFADVLSQLDLTWDLHSLSVEQLLELLPSEFDEFHRSSAKRQLPLIE